MDPQRNTLAGDHRDLSRRIASGLLWQLGGRGGDRAVRLLANVALARLLSPDDFGLLGMACVALAATEAMTFFATEEAIVHHLRARDRSYLGTVFCIGIVRGLLLALVLVAAAPALAAFFGHREARSLFVLAALQPMIAAMANPGAVLLIKDLRFGPWTTYRLLATLAGSAATIGLAVALRSAVALVVGQLITTAAVSAGSWLVTARRPAFTFDAASWRDLRRYLLGAAGTPILLALINQAPTLLLGRWAGAAMLGTFLLNQRLAEFAVRIGSHATGRVFVPAFSRCQSDRSRLATLWIGATRGVCLFTLPAATLIAWCGDALPVVFFGDPFRAAPGTVALLALGAALAALAAVSGALVWGIGRPALDRRAKLGRAAMIYAAGMLLVPRFGDLGLAAALALSSATTLLVILVPARRLVDVPWASVGRAMLPGLTGAAILGAVLAGAHLLAAPDGAIRLLVAAATGGCFAAVAFIAWRHRAPRIERSPAPVGEAVATG